MLFYEPFILWNFKKRRFSKALKFVYVQHGHNLCVTLKTLYSFTIKHSWFRWTPKSTKKLCPQMIMSWQYRVYFYWHLKYLFIVLKYRNNFI